MARAAKRTVKTRATWERGYNSHGYWQGKSKVGMVALERDAPPERKYRWEAGTSAGYAATLPEAKRAVEGSVLMGERQLTLFSGD